MTPQPKKNGMIEDLITLGHKGSSNGLRHFVAGKPIQAGSYMEVKFGGGWIPGRYEWSFEKVARLEFTPLGTNGFRSMRGI
ncbi:hypothetical protein ACT3XG_16955 [Paenibacillus polymyxa]|uniref:hypothetical protein n=1 Tax=Paenibacillus TaxID=44249 RepID=UPI00142D7AD1|nr:MULTISPECIES: hypothetical protein [Paenibacillus]MEB4782720.1 hypothetical protein [Paenibacillus jamilae]KAF6659684.1 hypothetical protein HFD99_03520 [Paenibacillus sp. EKM301P]MDG0052416.1 hypothetical protein [Paenibacillus sp. P2(2022)]UBS85828.1 hypothetical protein LAZ93_16900 [Paenibacillus polymyxa]WHX34350.1 hypothetical protein QNH38_17385 [Paenibacillus polymyxa]